MRSALSLLFLISLCHFAAGAVVNHTADGERSGHLKGVLKALNAPSQGRAMEHPPTGKKGAVATEVDVCSNVGADILAKKGTAADAIIAASLCVGSIDAFHSGIGGGGFILVRAPNGTYEQINMRESMPAAGNETMYSNNTNPTASTIGGLAVGVPGEIRGWEALHARHGKLPWKDLFAPAIKLNRYGFKVPNQLAINIKANAGSYICNDPYFAETYCPNGTAVGEGDTIKRERYADALERIAKDGPDAFYTGKIAVNTVAAAYARGGIITLDDLRNYSVIISKPENITFRGARVFSTSAPSSGTFALSALKTMAQYGSGDAGVNLTTHRIIEATKFAYGERSQAGDPRFVPNMTELEASWLSDAAAQQKHGKIQDNATLPLDSYNPGNYTVLTDHGTSALVAVDRYGGAVSLTTTVNLIFGSQVMTADGIILNDEMDDFSSPGATNAFGYVPTEANFIRPFKRPLSSISPLIAEDARTGELILATASAGGSHILTANIQNSFAVLSSNGTVNIQAALSKPRWHDQLQPQTTSFEWADSYNPTIPDWKGFDNSTVAFLASVGHNVSFVAPGSSTAQGVERFRNATFLGGAEIRQLAAKAAAV